MSQSGEEEPKYITTGCQNLDALLGGGVAVRGITEVTGQSGSGKTQFTLQLSLCAQLPPDAGGLGKGTEHSCHTILCYYFKQNVTYQLKRSDFR